MGIPAEDPHIQRTSVQRPALGESLRVLRRLPLNYIHIPLTSHPNGEAQPEPEKLTIAFQHRRIVRVRSASPRDRLQHLMKEKCRHRTIPAELLLQHRIEAARANQDTYVPLEHDRRTEPAPRWGSSLHQESPIVAQRRQMERWFDP
jgi:hypothetical protein